MRQVIQGRPMGGREHTFQIGVRASGASAVASPPRDDFPFECNIIRIPPGYTKTRPCDVHAHAPHGRSEVLTRGKGTGKLERAALASPC